MSEGKVVILSAPSGAGKTTIVKNLLERDLKLEFSISACSRSPRAGEKNGVDYYFLSPAEFKKKIDAGSFIEWEEVYEGNYYGTLKSEIQRIWKKGNHVLFEVDVKGGINLKNYFKDNALSVFIKPPSIEDLRKRLVDRSTEPIEEIEKRMKRAEFEISFSGKFDKIIINDVLEDAKKKTYQLVKGFLQNKGK